MNSTSIDNNSSGERPQQAARSRGWWILRFLNVGLFFAAGILLILLLGLAQRTGWIQSGSFGAGGNSAGNSQKSYTCPMHPQIRQPGEGRCPICGMALVPAAKTGEDLDEFAVNIEPAQRRLANIQTAEVQQQTVSSFLNTIGEIQIDESREATIASYIDGRVERLFADYTGVEVQEGDHLAVVYSPQLYAAQVEYLESKRALQKSSNSVLESVRDAQTRLAENSRQRLVELGMTDEQLTELETTNKAQSRLTIFAPIGGTVIEKLAEEGKYLSAGEPIYRIANLSTVWLMLELYPEDASRIRFGQIVEAELTSLPGETRTGRVAFIDPTVNEQSRTVGVRVEFSNEEGRLRPGDYAKAQLTIPIGPQGTVYDEGLAGKWISPMHPQIIREEPGECPICGMKLVPTSRYGYADQPVAQPKSVVIPRSALLMAGNDSVVYVETEPGRFELRSVVLGNILKEQAIVLEGLKVGEQVATSGNFLIDSQMQLAGKPSLINPTRYTVKPKENFRNTPMQFEEINVAKIEGATGEKLEQLYQSYFEVQKTYSEDKLPQESSVSILSQLAAELSQDESLNDEVKQQIEIIAENSPHLNHLELEASRQKFKQISHVILTLSTKVRGEQARQSFQHFFCPMVKQGEGDWLQSEGQLRNPYYGEEMLRCGELVRTIPITDEANNSEKTNEKSEQE
ncbi:efflux RND transporter periplasmic adaptor subunit [Rubinisphaera italica]|uniref:Cation efflux system protein CusB n=1 Tax=Rubinisphaera italica TaxID=2527969 RepID=A0A5C5XEG7_9PLAN|nr:efflux RND transporter periplasmic adaptor subunit [Rubinisphaera italica]TWT60505.1 Cation efflux system protein CusB precursor [Rubinisphaera italica]